MNVLKNVLGIRKDWAIAANQLGMGYRGLGDLKNAVATFKRIVDLDKNSVVGLFNLGEAYNASGNAKEAKKINDQLRKINPSAAAKLDNVLSGKAVIDATKQKIENKIPIKIPKFPF
ncbi:MAG: tetratricopeptide repeat protein [Pyrinomonadaceae bacterium]